MGRPAERRLRLLFLYLAVALPLIAYGAVRVLKTNVNSPLEWVPGSFPPRAEYDAFGQLYGPGDVVVVGWDGCTIDDPRLDELVRHLRQSPEFFDQRGDWLFDRVVSSRELVSQLTSGLGALPLSEAVDRLQGTLIGPDRRTTCLIVAFAPNGLKQRQQLVALIRLAVSSKCGVAQGEQHLAGPVIDGLSVDVASQDAMSRLALLSAGVVLVAACTCLRSVRMGLLVFAIASFSQAATLAFVYFSGETMSALLIVLPPLIQVLALAGGIHLANYYFDALAEHGTDGAPGEAFRRGWLPCVLSFGTTAAGMASLMVSQLTPIRSFGAFAAAGALLTAGMLLAVLPALLARWPIPPRKRTVQRGGAAGDNRSSWSVLTSFLARYHVPVIAGGLVLMVACSSGICDLKSSVRIETLFGPESTIVSDYGWLERHVGPLVPIELVLQFDEHCLLSLEDRMHLLWQINTAAQQVAGVESSFSALHLLPAFPPQESMPQDAYRNAVHKSLVASRPFFHNAGRLRVDQGCEQWRLTFYVSALRNVDYGAFLTQLRSRLDPLLRDDRRTPLPGISAVYTGIMPLVHEIQRQLMSDLFRSFLAAFVVITLVMSVAQAGLFAGLVTMIPNILPTLVMFGLLGLTHTPLDIGTVMTASIALGIAVDDTLHYVTFFQRGLALGLTRRDAVQWAYEHCGRAMLQTSAVCGLGLLVFAWSSFVPTQRFACVMAAMMALAIVGDLVLLPALLLSRAGKLFELDVTAQPIDRAHDTPQPHFEAHQLLTKPFHTDDMLVARRTEWRGGESF